MKSTLPHRKVHIATFGCQMNEYDSDKILEILNRENYHYTDEVGEADLILLNTCSVRDKAEQKVYSLLGRLRKLKQSNPNLKIGVGGCVAQQEGERILARERSVDLVFGTDNLFELPKLLEGVGQGERLARTNRLAPRQKVRNFIPEEASLSKGANLKAHLAITKGCNNFCSFCIVPVTRGLEVSREPENILQEARNLVAQGVCEICLLGQNVNSYRADGVDFVELLRRMDNIEGLQRIRFMSPHPKDFREELAEEFADLPSLCEQLHLPLQSGSDRVLRRMRRWYTLEKYLEKVELYRRYVPNGTLSTDMIVGFPGETEEDFEQTLQAIKTVRYDQIYAFKYSPRPDTPAAAYLGQLPEEVKIERLRLLLELQEPIVKAKNKALIGSVQEVLVEGPYLKDPSRLNGRSRGYHSVAIANCSAKPGELVPVRIIGAKTYLLEAELLSK
jgi:tRNA-2-methylthio-N6-dimethylallyladenosine synthase